MAPRKKTEAVVYEQRELAAGIYDMWIETDLGKEAKPGQFVAVYPKDASTLLPRPISICEIDEDKKHRMIRIVYRVAGKGTTEFSRYRAGDKLQLLGCLGNGFPMEKARGKRVFLIGGGIGVPPLLQLAKKINGQKEIVLGYRDKAVFLSDELGQYGDVSIATEDGSVGTKGNVIDAIRANRLTGDIIYACGPMPMLRAVKKYAEENQIDAYISLEERMACGVGACLGCVCKTTKIDHHSHVKNARICTDGPVFEAREVDI